ncbi:MAG TPA: BON domain-containing protein [Thermoanaerobaculia bacterium]|nr:BON domain-containing protein [Thermoanaerobaculia bacterium]
MRLLLAVPEACRSDSRFEKARADDIAARVNGVELVVNRLDVDADRRPLIWDPFLDDSYSYGYDWWSFEPQRTLRSDSEIERNIESQLFWSPFVDADEISVTVNDGVAKLSGTVGSWNEWRAARTNAFEGGAVWVDNDLGVSSDVGASGLLGKRECAASEPEAGSERPGRDPIWGAPGRSRVSGHSGPAGAQRATARPRDDFAKRPAVDRS